MRSPGVPSLRSEIERLFWEQIAIGITSEKAAEAVGVSSAVGTRWFRYRGGMPLFMSNHMSGRYLSFAEREEIGLLRAQSVGKREIGHCVDNVACEGFFGMLKRERVNHRRYRTLDIAKAEIFNYIERFHNPRMRRRVAKRDLEFSAFLKQSVKTG